ncbi:MAG: competence/damage-inducible protein A [Bacteroidetes bacterium]|nr:competence/damage-inducible protein A [Bacteroidota bacterium]
MRASIVAIGDELLIGQVVNTNASWLGDRLTRLGWQVRRVIAVGDMPAEIRSAIESEAGHVDMLLLTGGLGPTQDDRTRDVICDILGCGLAMDESQLVRIRGRFEERGLELNERSIRQALAPEAARKLPNNHGSAPGLAFAIGSTRCYALPGVPSEMRGIFTEYIAPELGNDAASIDQQTWLTVGITESALADSLQETEPLLDDDVTLAYLPSLSGVRLRLMRTSGSADARGRYERLRALIAERAGAWIVTDRDETLAAAVGRVLRESGLMLATAESCTGGMIGSLLTDIPGSSDYYLGGVVSYANSMKQDVLGVSGDTLRNHGAVSGQVAEEMALGALRITGADIAVAVTGIAGPDGGTEEKPVGTVWIAIASARGARETKFNFGRERAMVRERSSATALEMVRREALALCPPDDAARC